MDNMYARTDVTARTSEATTKLSKKILLAVTISHLDLPLSFILPTATLVVVLLIVGQS